MSLDNWGSGKIIESAAHGEHIDLCCKNHPNLRWSTKNIAPIGCRKIFFDLMRKLPADTQECECSINELIPVNNS